MTTTCPTCGAQNRDGARFCLNCGALQPSPRRICPVCGTENLPEARFCHHCAAPLDGSQASPPPTGTLPPQTRLAGRYVILKKLGQGGMGAVYQVADVRIQNKLWAAKELSDAALTDPRDRAQAADSFRQEAEMLSRLSHPNLPRVVDYFNEGGKQFLVMDYVEGETLHVWLERQGGRPFPESDVLHWARQLCDVLAYLHGQSPPIIFRDLKPGNIMIDPQNRVKLIDFGIARLFKPGKAADTTSFGTAGYAPREQYGKGQGQTDPRSDLYALGATMHHLLTGCDPAVIPFHFEPVRALNPAVSPALEQVVMKAVEQEPVDRWPHALAMRGALEGVRPATVGIGPTAAAVSPAKLGTPAGPPPPVVAQARHRARVPQWVLVGGALCVLALAISMVLTGVLERGPSATATARARSAATVQAWVAATGLAQASGTAQVRASGTAAAQLALTARSEMTSAAQAHGTETAQIVATQIAGTAFAQALLDMLATDTQATAAAAGQLTATARAKSSAAVPTPEGVRPTDSAEVRFLAHDEDGFIELSKSGRIAADFVVDAEFVNPYSPQEGGWDYGFLFRAGPQNDFYDVWLDSAGDWGCNLRSGDATTAVASGHAAQAYLADGARNFMRLIAIGDKGLFFINDEFVAQLDLSGRLDAGDIEVATGIVMDHEIPGRTTRVEGFRTWTLNVEATDSDVLIDEADGFIQAQHAGVDLAHLVTEATFVNPDSGGAIGWDYGFLVRSATGDTKYAIGMDSAGRWFCDLQLEGAWTAIGSGQPANSTLAAGEKNTLIVVAFGDAGWFFVNDQLAAKLDLSGHTASGNVAAATGMYANHELAGRLIAFENFTVWSLQ